MIKKVPLDQLVQGMFVHDLNCNWLGHPFVANRFLIKDDATLKMVRELDVEYVLIDTSRGADVSAVEPPPAPAARHAPAEPRREAPPKRQPQPPPPPEISALEELETASRLQSATFGAVRDMFDDSRRGRPVELAKFDPLIEELMGSLRRNKHALLSLSRLRKIDAYTYEHSVGVAILMMAFGRDLGLSDDAVQELGLGGMLHDIGKSRIDPAILNKPGKLDDREKTIMRGHVELGERIVDKISGIPTVVREVVAQHHERLDRSGYPRKLSGEKIALHARMAAIADTYDALSSDRSYASGMEPTETLRRLLEWPEGKLSPTLVQRFIQCVGIYPVGSLVRLASERLAVVIDCNADALLRPKVRVVYDIRHSNRLPMIDLDLNTVDRAEERIVNFERHGTWGIAPFSFMTA